MLFYIFSVQPRSGLIFIVCQTLAYCWEPSVVEVLVELLLSLVFGESTKYTDIHLNQLEHTKLTIKVFLVLRLVDALWILMMHWIYYFIGIVHFICIDRVDRVTVESLMLLPSCPNFCTNEADTVPISIAQLNKKIIGRPTKKYGASVYVSTRRSSMASLLHNYLSTFDQYVFWGGHEPQSWRSTQNCFHKNFKKNNAIHQMWRCIDVKIFFFKNLILVVSQPPRPNIFLAKPELVHYESILTVF